MCQCSVQGDLLVELRKQKPEKPKPLPPPKWDGLDSKRDVNQVIFDFEEYNTRARLTEAEAIACLAERLEGEARRWWRTLVQSHQRPTTWADLTRLMRDKWLGALAPERQMDAFWKFLEANPASRTPVSKFNLDVETRILALPEFFNMTCPEVCHLVRHLYIRYSRHDIRKELMLRNPSTLKDAMEMAARVDGNLNRARAVAPFTGQQVRPQQRPQPMELGNMEAGDPYDDQYAPLVDEHDGPEWDQDPAYAEGGEATAELNALGPRPALTDPRTPWKPRPATTDAMKDEYRRKGLCFHCGGKGHTARTCRYKPKPPGKAQGQGLTH